MTPTKANILVWFANRAGCEVDTKQVRPNGLTWEPGPRVVKVGLNGAVHLDGSKVDLRGSNHVVLAVADDHVSIEWQDDDGTRIHVTTYRDVAEQFDPADDE